MLDSSSIGILKNQLKRGFAEAVTRLRSHLIAVGTTYPLQSLATLAIIIFGFYLVLSDSPKRISGSEASPNEQAADVPSTDGGGGENTDGSQASGSEAPAAAPESGQRVATGTEPSESSAADGATKKRASLAVPDLPVRTIHPSLKAVDAGSALPKQLLRGGDALWIVGASEVSRFEGEDPAQGRRVLDSRIYDEAFDRDFVPLTSGAIGPNGTMFVGASDGQLLEYRDLDWRTVWEPHSRAQESILSMATFNGDLFIGSKGLWRYTPSTRRLTKFPSFAADWITSIGPSGNRLLMTTESAVWLYSSQGWVQFWKLPDGEKGVLTAAEQADGSFLVGTEGGLFTLNSTGVIAQRLLTNIPVQSIAADRAGRIWLGTRGKGLFLLQGGRAYAVTLKEELPDNRVATVGLDRANKLWLGFTVKGVFVADPDTVASWVTEHPYVPEPSATGEPRTYSNPCKAAEAELRGAKSSGGVSFDSFDGIDMVYLDGHQVCPRGAGFRSGGGDLLLIKGWTLTKFSQGKREDFQIPEKYPADQAKVLFLDSQQRIWVGTSVGGPLMFAGGAWTDFPDVPELQNNPVTAITEDTHGAVWIGSMPPFDKALNAYTNPNLHRFDSSGWVHFSPAHGLGFWGTPALATLGDGKLAVGTNGGLSIMAQNETKTYREREGLLFPYVYGLHADARGNIWMTHLFWGLGVTWFNGTSFYNVQSKDGLFNDRIAQVTLDGKDQVWLVASNGNTGIYPVSYFRDRAQSATAVGVSPTAPLGQPGRPTTHLAAHRNSPHSDEDAR